MIRSFWPSVCTLRARVPSCTTACFWSRLSPPPPFPPPATPSPQPLELLGPGGCPHARVCFEMFPPRPPLPSFMLLGMCDAVRYAGGRRTGRTTGRMQCHTLFPRHVLVVYTKQHGQPVPSLRLKHSTLRPTGCDAKATYRPGHGVHEPTVVCFCPSCFFYPPRMEHRPQSHDFHACVYAGFLQVATLLSSLFLLFTRAQYRPGVTLQTLIVAPHRSAARGTRCGKKKLDVGHTGRGREGGQKE